MKDDLFYKFARIIWKVYDPRLSIDFDTDILWKRTSLSIYQKFQKIQNCCMVPFCTMLTECWFKLPFYFHLNICVQYSWYFYIILIFHFLSFLFKMNSMHLHFWCNSYLIFIKKYNPFIKEKTRLSKLLLWFYSILNFYTSEWYYELIMILFMRLWITNDKWVKVPSVNLFSGLRISRWMTFWFL